MTEELKPCPFCGEKLRQKSKSPKYSGWRYHPENECIFADIQEESGEPFSIHMDWKDKIKMWNKRAGETDGY